ncbi:hypothetical protein HELRODRAFT_188027 [Helobdella robusta]|uniref:K Homology domain-containing protein n=1 Tax=Helobdella robusta TaxID=6412 RepID=T1FPK2_HELRO|nr:hypothetical protein HELRODRAFT_188027 [Helobdella robusta]ESO12885.1 hypothetical protein HELRODRAFT_188027 [Helobdella robusta]
MLFIFFLKLFFDFFYLKMSSRDLLLNGDSPYLSELFAEKTSLTNNDLSCNFKHSKVLLAQEIDRVTTGSKKMVDLHVSKPMKLEVKVRLPVKEYPNFNFMGKIIGQNANTLKQMQIETGTKMIIQGAGSLKDKSKEEELRKEGGKYAHLHEELHILIEAFGSASECYYKVSLALGRLNELFMMENIGDGGRMIPGRGGPMVPHRPHHARGPPASPAAWQSGNPRAPRPGPATTPKSSSQPTHHHYAGSSSTSNNISNSGVTNNNSSNHHHHSSSTSSNAYSLSSAFPSHGNDIPSYLRYGH